MVEDSPIRIYIIHNTVLLLYSTYKIVLFVIVINNCYDFITNNIWNIEQVENLNKNKIRLNRCRVQLYFGIHFITLL